MKRLLILSAIALCQPAAAQMFKCTDAKGKVTYSNTKCSELKLKDAGEVQDRVQVTPAFRPPPPSTPSFRPPPAPEAQPKPAAATDESQEKERRCFTVTGAGGKKVTRCNDKPDGPAE